MNFDVLKAILPLPNDSHQPPTAAQWDEFEKRMSLAFPADYKRYIDLYGPGRIGNYFVIYSPFAEDDIFNIEKEIFIQASVMKELQLDGLCPYPLYPSPGFLLPFGMTDNGDTFYWKTNADSDSWTVVVNESRSPDWDEFEIPMTEFLFGVLSKKLACGAFPGDFPRYPVSYESL